tara:strand:+ start:392 stop:562 length:171 start_codon:yes stop_codon:yes gene_type:complete
LYVNFLLLGGKNGKRIGKKLNIAVNVAGETNKKDKYYVIQFILWKSRNTYLFNSLC